MSIPPLSRPHTRLEAVLQNARKYFATDRSAPEAELTRKTRPASLLSNKLNNLYASAYVTAAKWSHLAEYVPYVALASYVALESVSAGAGVNALANHTASLTPEWAEAQRIGTSPKN